MKRLFVLIPALLLCLTGCADKEGTMSCNLSSKDVVTGYEVNSTYKVNYKGDYVETVETVEEVTSDKKEVLDTFEENVNTIYKAADDNYGGYTYSLDRKDNKLTSTVKIDYSKMNLDQFVKDQPTLKNYVEDGKLKVDGLKSMYEQMGATCE